MRNVRRNEVLFIHYNVYILSNSRNRHHKTHSDNQDQLIKHQRNNKLESTGKIFLMLLSEVVKNAEALCQIAKNNISKFSSDHKK